MIVYQKQFSSTRFQPDPRRSRIMKMKLTKRGIIIAVVLVLGTLSLVTAIRKGNAAEGDCFTDHVALMQRALMVPEADARTFVKEFVRRVHYIEDRSPLAKVSDGALKYAYSISVDGASLAMSKTRWIACNALLAEKKIPGLAMPVFVSKISTMPANADDPKLK